MFTLAGKFMKRALFLLSLPLFSQQTVNLGTLTVSDDAAASVRSVLLSAFTGATLLAAPIDASATTIELGSDIIGAVGQAIVIDGESMLITAVNGTQRTVTRGRLGTTAAAHSQEATVNVQRYPTLAAFVREAITEAVAAAMQRHPAGVLLTRRAEIAAAEAAIRNATAGAVQ